MGLQYVNEFGQFIVRYRFLTLFVLRVAVMGVTLFLGCLSKRVVGELLKSGKNRKRATIAVSVFALALGGGMIGAPSASASVTHSCAWWGAVGPIRGVPVYNGNICGALSRDGLVVNQLRYSWSSYGKTCNWWVDFDFYDGATRERYYHSQGQTVIGCSKSGRDRRSSDMPILARPGQMCVTIYTNRKTEIKRLVTTCQNI